MTAIADASLLRPVARPVADGTILAAIPRAPAWITLWELQAATGAGAGRVRAGVLATCWQRRRAKVDRPASGR